jgi:hypothetical protein
LQVSPHIKVYGIDFLTDMQALPLPFQNLWSAFRKLLAETRNAYKNIAEFLSRFCSVPLPWMGYCFHTESGWG